MKNVKFTICGGEYYWQDTNAKTLRGAKQIASRRYQQSAGGKIEIAIVDEMILESGEVIKNHIPVAVKYGFNEWINEF